MGFLSTAVLLNACGGDDDGTCAVGTLGCDCNSAGYCQGDLVCNASNTCEVAGSDSTDPVSTDSDSEPLGTDTFDSDHYANPAAGCDPQPENIYLTADETGWVDQCQNRFGIQGSWYDYTDQDGNGGGTSEITLDLSQAATGKVCAQGTAGAIQFGFSGTYWGCGIALDICDGHSLSACDLYDPRTNIIGFRATVEGELPATEIRVQFAETGNRNESAYLRVQGPGTADYLFADAQVWYSLEDEDTEASLPPANVESIMSIQFQVATIDDVDTAFNFCVSDVRPILQ